MVQGDQDRYKFSGLWSRRSSCTPSAKTAPLILN